MVAESIAFSPPFLYTFFIIQYFHAAAIQLFRRGEVLPVPDLYYITYIEVNLLCVFLLLYILHHLENSTEQHAANIAFKHVVVSLIAILMMDCLWVCFNGQTGQAAYWANEYIMACYLFLEGVIAYYWEEYTEEKLKLPRRRNPMWRRLLQVPLIVLFAVAFTAPWNNWMYYYDSENVYQRSTLFFLEYFFACGYLVISGVEILQSFRLCKTRQDRSDRLSMLSLFIMPLIGFAVTLRVPGIPVVWPLASLSATLIFSNSQIAKISTDSLTGLNNRRQFDKYLSMLTAEPPASGFVGLILMDIDDYKLINDTYGHYEGDKALAETAGILKDLCRKEDVFLARYGGDEFAIVSVFQEDAALFRLKSLITLAFDKWNQVSVSPCRITLSIGTEKFGPGFTDSIPSLIVGADQKLYREKRRKKADFSVRKK